MESDGILPDQVKTSILLEFQARDDMAVQRLYHVIKNDSDFTHPFQSIKSIYPELHSNLAYKS